MGGPLTPAIDAELTKAPPAPPLIISLPAVWRTLKTPITLTSNTRRASSTGYSSMRANCPWMPALLKTASGVPRSASMRANASATAAASVTSNSAVEMLRPASLGRPGSEARRDPRRSRCDGWSQRTSDQPSAASTRAAAPPMSPAAPVRTASRFIESVPRRSPLGKNMWTGSLNPQPHVLAEHRRAIAGDTHHESLVTFQTEVGHYSSTIGRPVATREP